MSDRSSSSLASGFVSGVHTASRVAGGMAAAMVAISIVIVCQLVFVRYLLREPTAWQTELVTYLLVGATVIGCPYVLMVGGHVSVNLLPHYLTRSGNERLALAGIGAGIFFCGIIFVSGCELCWDAWEGEWLSETVWAVPLWIPYSAVPLGFGLMLLQYLADLVELLQERRGGAL